MASHRPHVVIVGGGFAGLRAAKALSRAPVRVTLIDRRNHHLFQPLLYQVATAGLSAIDIGAPIRQILRRARNTTVLMAHVVGVEMASRRVSLSTGRAIDYDYLIIAVGASHSYFGHGDWQRIAPGLKTIEDALEIRRRILVAFERAEMEEDAAARQAWLTFVVIGAGPTGAELAGAVAELARHTLVREFRRFDPSQAHVLLLEGGKRVLPSYSPDLSARARRQLERLGVEVETEALVTDIDSSGVRVGQRRIAARTVLWAAGVEASHLGSRLGVPLDRVGRVKVQADLTVPGHPEVFVVGDLAYLEQDGQPIPGIAPAAIQQGRHAVRNIRRHLSGKPLETFRYRHRGSMATLGRSAAVAEIGRLHMSGLPAWLSWLCIHIFFLIGYRNRLVVLFEWAKSYLTFQRSARLILHESADPGEPETSLRE